MKIAFGILALTALAGLAQASSVSSTVLGSVTFTNKASVDAQSDVDNARDSWIAGAGGTVNSIRVTGSLTRNIVGTFANEARVRLTAGAGNSFTGFNVQATTLGSYTGTVAVGPTVVTVTPFTLAAGQVDFEWFESVQDGTAGLPESTWDSVTYDFTSSTVTNGGAALGALTPDGVTQNVAGSHVSGGLDFFSFSLVAGVSNPAHYLNLQMVAGSGTTGNMADTEFALYGPDGNLVATDDDGNVGFFSFLSFGTADPLANANTDAAGSDGASLLAGNYTLVTGGFNTIFAATVNGAHIAGANSGAYGLRLTYVPAPSALAFLGLGALAAGRRRR